MRKWSLWVGMCLVAVSMQSLPAGASGDRGEPRGGQERVNYCISQRAWMAYFEDDKGKASPVRNTSNTDHDQDWMGLKFTDYDGPRIRLGVLGVINKAPRAEEGRGEQIEVPTSGIQEMLQVALYNSKRFDIIEQQHIRAIEAQQTRKDIEEPSPGSIVKAGKVLGAQYLVYGTVNEWTPNRGGQSQSPLRFIHANKSESEVAITFSLADIATGQIQYTTTQRARLGEWQFAWSDQHGGGGATKEKTPIDYAVGACVNKAAFEIARFLRNRKWKGTVVDKSKAEIFVNAGSQGGMVPNTKLSVLAVQRTIRDREGGMILGEDLRGIGTLEVTAVSPAFSVARIVDGCEGIKPGDRVELATPAAPVPEPPECAALDITLH
jgi:curli biogenesis system outer membrane secretion channel CsgG